MSRPLIKVFLVSPLPMIFLRVGGEEEGVRLSSLFHESMQCDSLSSQLCDF